MSKKKSSVRHTRAIQCDRSKRPSVAPSAKAVEERLAELIHPATYNQLALFHTMGLRERMLALPVMVAFVLSLIWRQMGSVSEAVRVLNREGFLWSSPTSVSQQAVSERLRTLPALLFEGVFGEIMPQLLARHQARRRPLAPAVARALHHFKAVVALDGSTLDALMRKVGLGFPRLCGHLIKPPLTLMVGLPEPHTLPGSRTPATSEDAFCCTTSRCRRTGPTGPLLASGSGGGRPLPS